MAMERRILGVLVLVSLLLVWGMMLRLAAKSPSSGVLLVEGTPDFMVLPTHPPSPPPPTRPPPTRPPPPPPTQPPTPPPTQPPTPPPTLPPTPPPTQPPTEAPSPTAPPARCGSQPGLTCAIATGTSSNHFQTSLAMLLTVTRQARFTKIFYYDLGLDEPQRELLLSLREFLPHLELRKFPFDDYPPHVRMEAPSHGAYAWKPVIVEEVLREHDLVLWMDSGDRLLKPLGDFWDMLAREDFYGSTADHPLGEWAHPGIVSYFNISSDDPILTTLDCSAAFLGFSNKLYDKIILPWKACALVEKCISPPGSSLGNHRYDQSAIGILVMKLGKRCIDKWNKDDLFAIQRDWEQATIPDFAAAAPRL